MLDLKRYVPNGRVSSGMVIWYEGGLTWGVAKRKYWRTGPASPAGAAGAAATGAGVAGAGVNAPGLAFPLIGIGGGQEPGETMMQTLQREAREEANTGVLVQGARSTLWVHADGHTERRDLSAELGAAGSGGVAGGDDGPAGGGEHRGGGEQEPAPVLIWQSRITLLDADNHPYEIDYINPVWSATFTGEPYPGDEMPAILVIGEEQFLGLLHEPATLAALQAGGARLIGEEIPAEALVELQGSALYVAQHWRELEW